MPLGIPLLFWDVDTAFDFMHPEGKLYVPGAIDLLPALSRLHEFARENGIPVIASVDDHLPTDAEISDTPDFRETYPPHCMMGTQGAEKVLETRFLEPLVIGHSAIDADRLTGTLQTNPSEILVKKRTVDVFSNPNTEAVLRCLDPKRIVIYGVALDICVRWAIEGLWERGYQYLSLVTDATRPIDAALGAQQLGIWRRRGIHMLTTGEVLALDVVR